MQSTQCNKRQHSLAFLFRRWRWRVLAPKIKEPVHNVFHSFHCNVHTMRGAFQYSDTAYTPFCAMRVASGLFAVLVMSLVGNTNGAYFKAKILVFDTEKTDCAGQPSAIGDCSKMGKYWEKYSCDENKQVMTQTCQVAVTSQFSPSLTRNAAPLLGCTVYTVRCGVRQPIRICL